MEAVEKKRILVIEDEAHIADGIQLNLTLQGYETSIARDGIDGLEQWHSWKPDLIVLDIMLPMIDGFSILKTIRKEDEKIPVLILSARGDTKDKVKGLRYGVDDYLSKPFDLEEFLLRVERLIKKKGGMTMGVPVKKLANPFLPEMPIHSVKTTLILSPLKPLAWQA